MIGGSDEELRWIGVGLAMIDERLRDRNQPRPPILADMRERCRTSPGVAEQQSIDDLLAALEDRPMVERSLLKYRDVMERTGFGYTTVSKAKKSGALKSVVHGTSVRFQPEAVDAWVDSLAAASQSEPTTDSANAAA